MTTDHIRVLYAGLDAETAARITAALEARRDVETTVAADPADAVERVTSQPLDCVVSSEALEDGTGIELLRTVRESAPSLPYVLFAETLSDELLSEAIEAGVTDYLPQKPADARFSLLADRILDAISRYRATEFAGELERINTVVRDINRALVRASTREEIDRRVCEIISGSEPYVFAWVGDHDPASEVVTGRAAAGVEEGYLDEITITADEGTTAQGPTGLAVRTHEIQVMQDIPSDPAYEPWREEALKRGYRSSAAIPLVYGGTLYGVLNVYADRVDAFDADERDLLDELGNTIAYAHHEIQIHSEARQFQRAVEQAADAIFITDADGTIEYVNPAFEELTEYTASEAIGQNPRILKSGEQSTTYYESMWDTILDGEIWKSEIVNAKRSGELYYSEQTIAPITDTAGEIDRFVAIQRDVTERKERERALERSEKRLRILFDQAPDGIIVHDVDGEIRDVNRALIENLGYTRAELRSMNITDIEVSIDEETVREQWQSMEPGSVHRVELEGTHRRKDGSTYPSEIWISRVSLETPDGGPEDQFIAFVRDITDRKREERERREIERRLALAIETAHAGVWEWDIRSESVIWEDSMERLLGLDPGSFGGTYEAFIERVHPEDREEVENVMRGALRRLDSFEREFRLRRESGDYVWILARAQLLTDPEESPERMVGISIDISERTDRARQLRVMDRVLRHNLRNDMTAIQGNAETIRMTADSVREEAETIVEKSRQLMRTVEKEREIVEVITQQPERRALDVVDDICQRAVAGARDDHPAAEIDFEHPDEAAAIATKRLERALEELLENAIVHNDRDPPTVSLTVELRDETVRIEIADNGPGIPEEEVNVLTREYEIEPLYHGSGLGLWLVNWIVGKSGGTLTFEENEPRGSVVAIEIQRAT